MTVSIDYPAEEAEPFLGAALLASHAALAAAISALAEARGTDDLSWLDTIQEQAVLAAKGNYIENASIETEVAALEFGLLVLEGQFATIKADMVGDCERRK